MLLLAAGIALVGVAGFLFLRPSGIVVSGHVIHGWEPCQLSAVGALKQSQLIFKDGEGAIVGTARLTSSTDEGPVFDGSELCIEKAPYTVELPARDVYVLSLEPSSLLEATGSSTGACPASTVSFEEIQSKPDYDSCVN